MKLLFFGRASQCGDAGLTPLDSGGDFIEVPGAHLLLMRDKCVAAFAGSKFRFLHLLDVSGHATLDIVLTQVVHVVPHGVNTGEGNELVLVAHGSQFTLELGNGGIVQIFLPVK